MKDILAKIYSMKEKSKKDNRSLTSLIDELEISINATGDSLNQELIKAIKQRNNENKKVDKIFSNFLAQVRKSVDSPPGMLTEDHHHTVHEERQVCYSSHLRPKSLHL